MSIRSIAWNSLALPFRKVFVSRMIKTAFYHGFLITVESGTGVRGHGEAPVSGNRDEAAMVESAAGKLVGLGVDEALLALLGIPMPGSISCGLETALLDLKSREMGAPMCALLGSQPAKIEVNALIATDDAGEAAEQARQAVRDGFKTLKVKVGMGSSALDDELIASVRSSAGEGTRIRLDANQAWTAKEAVRASANLAGYKIEYLEQPVRAADLEGLVAVRRAGHIRVAADESVSAIGLDRLLSIGAADVYVIKLRTVGGPARAAAAIGRVVQGSAAPVVTSSLESSIGIAAGLHVACLVGSSEHAHGLGTAALFEEDLADKTLLPKEGSLSVADGPGIGVRPDRERLQRVSTGVNGIVGDSSSHDMRPDYRPC